MGFRTGAYATVWSAEPVNERRTQVRISISRKDKTTDQYIQEFAGFVSFVGTATAAQAARLKERDRIRLGDVDVTSRYDKEQNKDYTNFTCFSFEMQDGRASGGGRQRSQNAGNTRGNVEPVESFDEVEDDRTPF